MCPPPKEAARFTADVISVTLIVAGAALLGVASVMIAISLGVL